MKVLRATEAAFCTKLHRSLLKFNGKCWYLPTKPFCSSLTNVSRTQHGNTWLLKVSVAFLIISEHPLSFLIGRLLLSKEVIVSLHVGILVLWCVKFAAELNLSPLSCSEFSWPWWDLGTYYLYMVFPFSSALAPRASPDDVASRNQLCPCWQGAVSSHFSENETAPLHLESTHINHASPHVLAQGHRAEEYFQKGFN